MHFKVAGVHREFFQKNGYIEFESLLTPAKIASLKEAVDQTVEKRIQKEMEYHSAEELFKAGHDLWRDNPVVRKEVLSHTLGGLAADLFKAPVLHIAYDQVLRTTSKPGFSNLIPSSLQEISSIQPLAGAALIHLAGTSAPSDILPSAPENVMFFSPDLMIPWEIFFQTSHQSYLLITYAFPESVYVLEKRDPHTHALKKLGYVFGDRLRQDQHPFVFRT